MLCCAFSKAILRSLVELDRMATDNSSISYYCRLSTSDPVTVGMKWVLVQRAPIG